MNVAEGKDYAYWHARGNPSHAYLLPVIERTISALPMSRPRVIDVGCGNGSVAGRLEELGARVVGVEPSDTGIRLARERYPQIEFHQLSCYDDLAGQLGQFDLVVCLEVIEHLYSPRLLAKTIASLVAPDGLVALSTPFHGYAKYLALAISGRMSKHLNPLNEGGHIKFFTPEQLTACLNNAGLTIDKIDLVGRIRPLAKSMVAIARRAESSEHAPKI